MNELDWNLIGAATAVAFFGMLFLAALLPMLKARLCAFARIARRAPVRFAAICLAAGAMIAYGGTKPSGNGYRVVFNGGASDATGSTATLECEMGKVYNLPPNGFSRAGKTFLGWSAVDTGRIYDDGMMIFNLTNTPGAVVEFQAVWK